MKRGDVVRIVDENDCRDGTFPLAKHGIPIGTEVTVLRYDDGDDSWLVSVPPGGAGTWVYEACLTEAVEVTPREIADAIASIKRAAINT